MKFRVCTLLYIGLRRINIMHESFKYISFGKNIASNFCIYCLFGGGDISKK